MIKKNLTKKQILNTPVLELLFRLDVLHLLSANRPTCAGVPILDIQEADDIIWELQRRLVQIVFLRFQDGGLCEN